MRIALVITELHPGGAEKCFVNLACFLKRRGHDVRVWQLWPAPPLEKSQLTEQLDRQQIDWRSGQAVRPWQFATASWWLKRELIRFRPEVVQSFLFHANLATAWATRRMDCRFFGGARVAQPERWRQSLEGWAAAHMQQLVCVSHSVADHCHRVEKIAREKLVVIPNGIELEEINHLAPPPASMLSVPAGTPVLLFVGRLTEQKGIVDFIKRQSQAVLASLPDHQLVVVGDGEQAAELQRLRTASPYRDRIHLVGWQARVAEWLRLADLLLLPTKYEGMPNVILEAMAAGRAIVSFDVDGVAELLGDRPAAAIQKIPPSDWAGFSAAVIRLAQDERLRVEIGHANRVRVEQAFQLEPQLAKYERLYGGDVSRTTNSCP